MELPALYFDVLNTSAAEGIYVENGVPEIGSLGAARDGSVGFDIIAAVSAWPTALTEIVDYAETYIYINDVLAWDDEGFKAGFSGTVEDVGQPEDYERNVVRFVIDHSDTWSSEQVVSVRVVSKTRIPDLG